VKILVTGASGFIGSAFVVRALEKTDCSIVAMIRDTDRRHQARLFCQERGKVFAEGQQDGRVRIVNADLLHDISGVTEGCDAVVNFAAKTFVDHSIRDPWPFIEANVVGTYRILEDARKNKVKFFVQVSTDEVYGAILDGAYKEDARLNPSNPYAASKAGADALVQSYANTFGMWTAITRTENNYGPFQHSQKVIPAFVRALNENRRLPVYGDGKHRRQWLWVDDHVDAILLLLKFATMKEQGLYTGHDLSSGQIFHVAGSQELENLELAKAVIIAYDKHYGQEDASRGEDLRWRDRVQFIDDHDVRPGHDRRYALVCDKMAALGWGPQVSLEEGIERAVAWYALNSWWLT
jgi:dTDP-glucose 4,6-dehydratase